MKQKDLNAWDFNIIMGNENPSDAINIHIPPWSAVKLMQSILHQLEVHHLHQNSGADIVFSFFGELKEIE